MTHEELLAKIDEPLNKVFANHQEVKDLQAALRAVVELHKPIFYPDKPDSPVWCNQCAEGRGYAKYPCPTIQAIQEQMK